MNDTNLTQYKQRVEEIEESLLDVIASVASGNLDAKVTVPENSEVLANLAIGLEYLIEDLREMAQKKESDLPTGTSPAPEFKSPKGQSIKNDKLHSSMENGETLAGMSLSNEGGFIPAPKQILSNSQAVSNQQTVQTANGESSQSLSVPIKLQDEIIGVLGFNRNSNIPWTPQEISTVESITEQIGLALENQRLFEQTQAALAEADTLYQATAAVNTAESYQEILHAIRSFSQLGKLASEMKIGLFDQPLTPSQSPFSVQFVSSIPTQVNDATIPQQIPFEDLGNFLDEHNISSSDITFVNNIHQNSQTSNYIKDTEKDVNIQSMAFIPLVVGGQWIGLIQSSYTGTFQFSEDEIRRTSVISSQASVAIQNLRSLELAEIAVEEMREVDRLKSEFLANMSHELRTPLNSIIGFSRVILKGIDGPINEIQEQDLTAIHTSGQHLLDMINNILDLSKIDAGKMELHIEEIELQDVLESVISTARGLIKEKPIKLISKIPEQLPQAYADRTRVRQIMLNLLQNASKFTDEGTITAGVEITEDQKFVKLYVSDTGIGISDKDQEKLFERFSQVDSSLTRKVGGTGLGLSITKALVEMQNGEIGLDSEVGKGSTFWFTVPIVIEEPADHSSEDFQPSLSPHTKVIVSIDDDERVISLYQRYLKDHGYHVIPITNSSNALALLKEIKPYAITLDIMMENKDGWQIIQEIKEDPETKDIPVIICSIVEERDKAYQLGAVSYLVKPILETELVQAITALEISTKQDKANILVIDDDPGIFPVIQLALQNEDQYQLTFAQGGFAGLEALKNNQPDALILDLMMPDLDGFSILETMQGDSALRKIPTIVLTAADLSSEQRAKIDQTHWELLTKGNLNENRLINYLENALSQISTPPKE